ADAAWSNAEIILIAHRLSCREVRFSLKRLTNYHVCSARNAGAHRDTRDKGPTETTSRPPLNRAVPRGLLSCHRSVEGLSSSIAPLNLRERAPFREGHEIPVMACSPTISVRTDCRPTFFSVLN